MNNNSKEVKKAITEFYAGNGTKKSLKAFLEARGYKVKYVKDEFGGVEIHFDQIADNVLDKPGYPVLKGDK